MGQDGQNTFERHTDEAWRELRRQLADHLAGMAAHEPLVLEVAVEPGREQTGAAPYVQLLAHGDDAIRAEAVSDAYLDSRWALGDAGNDRLAALGWCAPTRGPLTPPDDGGSDNWFVDRPRSRADELAVLTVRTLREVFGCPHPAFLIVEGGFEPSGAAAPSNLEEVDPSRERPGTIAEAGERDRVTYPRHSEQLTQLVAEALAEAGDGPIEADEDGDYPLRLGQSVLFVRVLHDEPTVELFAELVHDVRDREAAAREVNLLNRELGLGSVHVDGDTVRFRHSHCAVPFSPLQLRLVVGRVASDLDERAELLAQRVDGLRFFEPDRSEDEPPEPSRPPFSPVLADQEVLFPDEEPAHPMVPVITELLAVARPLAARRGRAVRRRRPGDHGDHRRGARGAAGRRRRGRADRAAAPGAGVLRAQARRPGVRLAGEAEPAPMVGAGRPAQAR